MAFKNYFYALEGRAFTESPDLKWKYHNPEKLFKNNLKKYPKKFAKVPKMGWSKNGGMLMTPWAYIWFESGLRSLLDRFAAIDALPCNPSFLIIKLIPLLAAVR